MNRRVLHNSLSEEKITKILKNPKFLKVSRTLKDDPNYLLIDNLLLGFQLRNFRGNDPLLCSRDKLYDFACKTFANQSEP